MALATTQIHELMGRYEAAIYKLNDVYELHDRISLKPVRHENINGYGFDSLCHLLYMCQQIREWCEELPSEPALLLAQLERNVTAFAKHTSLREKIMRWLGWLQAKLHSEGLLSMEQAKRDLMPPGAEFSATGG